MNIRLFFLSNTWKENIYAVTIPISKKIACIENKEIDEYSWSCFRESCSLQIKLQNPDNYFPFLPTVITIEPNKHDDTFLYTF
jgi:hypothetical protein